jgi:hypothetical protein
MSISEGLEHSSISVLNHGLATDEINDKDGIDDKSDSKSNDSEPMSQKHKTSLPTLNNLQPSRHL